jgi:hypothetical protein
MRKQWVMPHSLRKVSLIVVLILFSVLPEVHAMGVFDPLVLFSEVHGTVLDHGKPVEGAELIQKVVWSDDEKENPVQHVLSDRSGAFRFPPIKRRAGLLRLIPAQPVMLQSIDIRYEGVEYEAWKHSKNSYNSNTELDGEPIGLVCELTQKPGYEGKHYGICRVMQRD